MDRARQFLLEDLINHALALEPALAGETRCDNGQAEMALAARPGAGMTGMAGGFVDDIESRRRQGGLELDAHVVGHGHGVPFLSNRLPAPSHKSIFMAMTRRVRTSRREILAEEVAAGALGRGCEWPECGRATDYPAPASPRNLNEKLWFCPHHVRDYNAAWDYFGILATRFRTADLLSGQGSPGKEAACQPGERRALPTLGLDASATLKHIKGRYKELVKRYDPDAGGGKSSEECLKRIIDAHHHLVDDRPRQTGSGITARYVN